MIKRLIVPYLIGLSVSYGCTYYDCTDKDNKPLGCDYSDTDKPNHKENTDVSDTCYVVMKGTQTLFNAKCFLTQGKAWDAIYKAYPSISNYDNFSLVEVNHAL